MGPPNPDGAWWLRADEVTGVRGRVIPATDGEHRIFDDPELLGLWERCIYSDRATIPPLRRGYGAYYRITQTATHVVILAELMHEARIVRLDSEHAPAQVLSYAGDSIGRWEGDTLVVDTTNFRRQGVARGANERRENSRSPTGVPHEGLHIVERFTPQDDGSLFYEFSVDDPDYEATWGGSFPWLRHRPAHLRVRLPRGQLLHGHDDARRAAVGEGVGRKAVGERSPACGRRPSHLPPYQLSAPVL